MKKIAIISDIHGNILALKAVVEDINRRNIDRVINLGDHISGPLWPKETIEYLMLQDWIQIKGNHDRQLLEQSPYEHGASDKYAYQTYKSFLRLLAVQHKLTLLFCAVT